MRVILLHPTWLVGGKLVPRCKLWRGRWSKGKPSANCRIDKTLITYGTFSSRVCGLKNLSVCFGEVGGEGRQNPNRTASEFVFNYAKCMWSNRIKPFSRAERILLLSDINQVKVVSKMIRNATAIPLWLFFLITHKIVSTFYKLLAGN